MAIVLKRRLSPIKMPDIVMEVTSLKLKGFKAELRGIATYAKIPRTKKT